jgi:hypothetical protein
LYQVDPLIISHRYNLSFQAQGCMSCIVQANFHDFKTNSYI